MLVDWTLGDDNGGHARRSERAHLIKQVRSRNDKIPIFLMAERGEASSIPVDVMEMVDEFVWTLEDTAAFVGGRVVGRHPALRGGDAASAGGGAHEVQPGVRVLLAYALATPAAPRFSSRPWVGSFFDYLRREPAPLRPLDQRRRAGLAAGSHRADRRARAYAARVFGAHRTYCVTNGTSMSNRVIFMAAVGRTRSRSATGTATSPSSTAWS